MERDPKRYEKVLPADGSGELKIVVGFNEKVIGDIAKDCNSASVKKSIAWLRRAHFNNPDKFICEVIDNVAFWAADICRKHMRLYEIAVKSGNQRAGYGRMMVFRMLKICQEKGLEKITFRAAKNETAVEFYKKLGATITGEKGEDWEMELKV